MVDTRDRELLSYSRFHFLFVAFTFMDKYLVEFSQRGSRVWTQRSLLSLTAGVIFPFFTNTTIFISRFHLVK
jgi:hypothetical protein